MINELTSEYVEVRFAKDEDAKKEKVDAFVAKLDTFFPNIEKLLKKNGGKYFTGTDVKK